MERDLSPERGSEALEGSTIRDSGAGSTLAPPSPRSPSPDRQENELHHGRHCTSIFLDYFRVIIVCCCYLRFDGDAPTAIRIEDPHGFEESGLPKPDTGAPEQFTLVRLGVGGRRITVKSVKPGKRS